MKKIAPLLAVLLIIVTAVTAQTNNPQAKHQYLLIFRFKSNFIPPSQTAVQDNIQKWQLYMGQLGQAGALVSGYRPAGGGKTISGAAKTVKDSVYVANNELISSFIIIKASGMDEATALANKCPIFEFDGSVEIRPLMETAN
jgi:hypothetical protein